MRQEGHNILDELNRKIDILDRELPREGLPPKSEALKTQNEKQREKTNRLKIKIMSLQDKTYSRELDFVYVAEEGLGEKSALEIKGNKSLQR